MKTGGGYHKRVGGVANLSTPVSLGYPLSTFLTCVVLKSSHIAVVIEGSQQVDWWRWKGNVLRAPDAGILSTAIKILRKEIEAGTATFLVKVKTPRHRIEPV